MEIFQPMCEIGKCLWIPLKNQINYIKKFRENFEKLNQEAKELHARKLDVDREIESEKVSKIPTNECEVWLKKVVEIENEVNELETEFKEDKKCLGKWCPNIWWRLKLSKHTITMLGDIAKLKKKSKFEGGVLVVAPPRIVEPTPTPTIMADTSTECTLRKILECLRDEKIKRIGVWGMGGVGKTTILKNLNTSQEIIQMFQIVIWVTVSKDSNVRKVQKEIGQRLSLKLEDDESNNSVASKLFQKLKTMKFLLLLDDVWDRVDLEVVGVPIPTIENCCKIILTSRLLNLCSQMETDKDIKIEVLLETEAWNLFHEKVGDVVDSSNIKLLAQEVVKECGGLPLVLVVIGRFLRNVNDIHVWSNALTELRKATFEVDENQENSVFMQLKISYDRLKDKNVKNCFLYCALYPEDFEIPIDELIKHWWVEGFIDVKLNFDEAYDKGHVILNDLINASLLERIEDYRHRLVGVKMHDVIRDLALKITSSEGDGFWRFVVKAGANTTDVSNEECWEQAERMILMHSDLTFLPRRPKSSLLKTLLLQNNRLKEIPESFFDHMQSLGVLNLSCTDINELPSSLGNLTSLRVLYLDSGYQSYRLPSEIGQLTRLEVLHLGGWIEYLPIEVGQLTRLRSLRLQFLRRYWNEAPLTYIIPDRLLSKLTLLEDLRILLDSALLQLWFPIFETKGVGEELVSLKHLISLHLHFPKVEYLEQFLQRSCNWNKRPFRSFGFLVGTPASNSGGGDRCLGFFEDDDATANVIKGEVLNQCSAFSLQKNKRCKKLSDFCSMEMMNRLEYCTVEYCNAMETLIDGNGLPNLEVLRVKHMPELRSIWKAPVPPQNITFLRILVIIECPELSNIFTRGMIQHLSNLETFYIMCCDKLEEIVSEEDMAAMVVDNEEDVALILFPRLKYLNLLYVPKLERICQRVQNHIAWPSLELINIRGCPNLKNFPLSSSRAPVLISVSHEAAELKYEDDATDQHVYYLCHGDSESEDDAANVSEEAVESECEDDATDLSEDAAESE